MALYSNWNVLTLPIKADGKYKIGDTYHVLDEGYPKFWKFDGLVIHHHRLWTSTNVLKN